MLRVAVAPALLALFFPSLAYAADIQVEQNPVPANSFAVVTLKLDKGDSVIWDVQPEPTKLKDVSSAELSSIYFNGPSGTVYTCNAFIVNFKSEKFYRKKVSVTMGQAPQPPPKPDPDNPNPPLPPKPPGPVTSFHVVFVYESSQTLTATQTGVLYSQEIRDYLDKNGTPDAGTKPWRLRDKDLSADNDTEFQKSLWAAIKPKVTTVPCWAVEVNGNVEIVPLPATVADGLSLLKKYKGDK